jgi:hypothetical protein
LYKIYGFAEKLFHAVFVATEKGLVDAVVELPEIIRHVLSTDGRFHLAKPCQSPSLLGI